MRPWLLLFRIEHDAIQLGLCQIGTIEPRHPSEHFPGLVETAICVKVSRTLRDRSQTQKHDYVEEDVDEMQILPVFNVGIV